MKGKGKKCRDSDDDSSPLVTDAKKIDISKDCPKYKEVIERDEGEGIKLEELDALQLEIESLLVSVVCRKRQIEDEMESLFNWQDKLKDKKKDQSSKRSKDVDIERKTKKIRESNFSTSSNSSSSSCSSSSSLSSNSKMQLKSKKSKNSKLIDFDADQKLTGYTTVPNDIPDRFWEFINSYCDRVTPESLKVLEDMLKSYEGEVDFMKTLKAPKWELSPSTTPEKLDASPSSKKDNRTKAEKRKGLSPSNSSESKNKKAKDSKTAETDKCAYGILTQRLVCCLIEEDFCAENFEDIFEGLGLDHRNSIESNLVKPINFGNTANFERLLKKELEEHGILDPDDVLMNDSFESEDDEMSREIMKCQNELRSVMVQNQLQLKSLCNLVRNDLERQTLERKIAQINEELLEVSKRILSVKHKKKSSKETKKDRDLAQKLLKERSSLVQKLDR